MVSYEIEKNLSLQDFIHVLADSGLGERRPMYDPDHLERMLRNSNLVIVARDSGQVVGVLRGLSDFSHRTFIADLAVIAARQGEGIGREMFKFARSLAPQARLFLFSAEKRINLASGAKVLANCSIPRPMP